jgi:hypothetical protein
MMRLKVENGMVGQGVGFERIRRITGYLVGTLDRFNTAKRAEVGDRVVHDGVEADGAARDRDNNVIRLKKPA